MFHFRIDVSQKQRRYGRILKVTVDHERNDCNALAVTVVKVKTRQTWPNVGKRYAATLADVPFTMIRYFKRN